MQLNTTEIEQTISEYLEKYLLCYSRINTKNLLPSEVLELQFTIYDTVEELRTAEKDDALNQYINYSFMIHSWRMLANNLLAI